MEETPEKKKQKQKDEVTIFKALTKIMLTVFSVKLAPGAFEIEKVFLIFDPLKSAPCIWLRQIFHRFFSLQIHF